MLNRWQRTIVDLRGNVVPYAQLQIRVESTQATATIYADRAGNELIPNGIVTADANGYAFFYAKADLYRISSMQPTIDWRYVDIGSANAVRIATEALDENLVTYPTLAELEADTTRDVNSMGRVVNDGSNNGYYLWDGTSWVRTSYQPMQRDEFDDLVLHVENDFLRKDIEQSAPLLRDIPQVGVVGLPYDVDQLYAQIWAARYPGLPAPSAYFEFGAGARLLSPDLTFSRASSAWGWRNGVLVEYDIDEPVFEDGGLRLWGDVTNLYTNNSSLVSDSIQIYGMDVSGVASIFEGKEAALYTTNGEHVPTYSRTYRTSVDTTKGYTHSVVVEIITDEDVAVRLRGRKDNTPFTTNWEGAKEALSLMEGVDVVSVRGPNGGVVMRFSAPVEPEADTAEFVVLINAGSDVVGEQVAVHHYQIEEGDTVGPMVWTDGSAETMAADQFRWTGSSFDRAFNPSQGALILRPKTSPTAFSALGGWHIGLDDGKPTLRTVNTSGGVIDEVQGDELDTDVRNGLGVAWTADTLTLYANGVLIGSIPRTGTPDGLVLRKDGVLNHERMAMFATRPTDAEMEALTHA